MRYYSYFPGCSASHGGSKAYNSSSLAAAQILDADLIELEDWNCCGSTPYTSVDELASLCGSARNLALAEKKGLDLVTPCSACYAILSRTNAFFNNSAPLRARIREALAAGGLEYQGTVKVRHILDVFANDIGYEKISSAVKSRLEGLKIGPYYGCQVVRPGPGFDDAEFPTSLDRILESLGAQAVPFALKSRCCGGSLMLSEEDVGLELAYKLLSSAAAGGAELLATVCPLCQTNLDLYQGRVNKKFKANFKLPVLFFTQLMGLAFGVDSKALVIDKCIVPAREVFARYSGV